MDGGGGRRGGGGSDEVRKFVDMMTFQRERGGFVMTSYVNAPDTYSPSFKSCPWGNAEFAAAWHHKNNSGLQGDIAAITYLFDDRSHITCKFYDL